MVVELIDAGEGVATFTATEVGERIFRCVGEDENGVPGEPTLVTVSVLPLASDNANDNQDANENENGNGSGNDNMDGNENDDTQDNGNDNEADNGDDDGGRRPGRPGR